MINILVALKSVTRTQGDLFLLYNKVVKGDFFPGVISLIDWKLIGEVDKNIEQTSRHLLLQTPYICVLSVLDRYHNNIVNSCSHVVKVWCDSLNSNQVSGLNKKI